MHKSWRLRQLFWQEMIRLPLQILHTNNKGLFGLSFFIFISFCHCCCVKDSLFGPETFWKKCISSTSFVQWPLYSKPSYTQIKSVKESTLALMVPIGYSSFYKDYIFMDRKIDFQHQPFQSHNWNGGQIMDQYLQEWQGSLICNENYVECKLYCSFPNKNNFQKKTMKTIAIIFGHHYRT